MKKTTLLLLAILAVAIFFRFFLLTSTPPGLYPDEAMDGNNALEALTTHQFKVFYPENNGREGLFMDIQALFLAVIRQNEPWVLRLPSAIFGVFTVLGIYWLGGLLFKSKDFGLLAAFLSAVSFWHINFSRISFRAIMAPFFLVWAVYFFMKSLESLESQKSILNAIASGLFFGLGFYSYIAYRPMPLLLLLIAWLYWLQNKERSGRKSIINAIFLLIIVAFLTALPLGIYFLNHPADFFGRTSELSVFSSGTPLKDLGLNILKTAGMFNIGGDNNWRQNIAGAPELYWPVGIMFLIGLFLAIKNILKKMADKTEKKAAIISISWLILAALPVVISNEGIPHALRSILMIPPVFMLTAWGGFASYKRLKNKIPRKLLLTTTCLLLALISLNTYYNYFIYWGQNQATKDSFSSNYVEIGRQLNALPQNLPKYVIVNASGVLVRGIPMPAQTVMFITNTFLAQNQTAKNIHYLLTDQINQIPQNSVIFTLK